MILEVITPDEVLFKGNVSHISLPGLDGSFGVLDNHAPLISALSKGVVKVDQLVAENTKIKSEHGKLNKEYINDASFTFEIKGGVIEIKDNKIMLLAE